jgi:ribosomal protein S18 acetylase RimI-like enzyme
MGGTDFAIRAAQRADAQAIAELHVAVWRATYRELAPPEAMQRLDVPFRQARWTEMLAKGTRTILVAESDGRIIGIGTAGAPSVPELGRHGEVLYLYVDSAFSGRGIGRALMRRLASALQAYGYSSAALGVVAGNPGAMAFYEKLGGVQAGRYTDPGPLWRSENLIYVWDDLAALTLMKPGQDS